MSISQINMLFSTTSSNFGIFSIETIKDLGGGCLKISCSMKMNCKRSKKNIKCHWVVVFSFDSKSNSLLDFFSKVVPESLNLDIPWVRFFSSVAKIVRLVTNLNRHFVFCLSRLQTSMISCF